MSKTINVWIDLWTTNSAIVINIKWAFEVINSKKSAQNLFEFAANNTDVEIALIHIKNGDRYESYVSTSSSPEEVAINRTFLINETKNIRKMMSDMSKKITPIQLS